MDRYSRQTILPEIGKDGQKKLQEARVLIVGVGGLDLPSLSILPVPVSERSDW